jgi:hypothetical protein
MERERTLFNRRGEGMFSREVESFSGFTIGQKWTGQNERELVDARDKRNLYSDLLSDSLKRLRYGMGQATLIRRNPRLTREKRNALLRKEQNMNQALRRDIGKYERLHDEWTKRFNALSRKKKNAPRGGGGGGGGGGSGGGRRVRTRQRVAVPLYK